MLTRRMASLAGVLLLAGMVTLANSPTVSAQKVETKDLKDTKKVDPKDTKKVDPKDTKKVDPKDPKDTKKVEFRDDWPKVKGTLAHVVSVDAKKGTAHVQFADGKKAELTLDKDVAFTGPRGGKAAIDDERFAADHTIKIVYDASGKAVKEIHLQIMKKADREK